MIVVIPYGMILFWKLVTAGIVAIPELAVYFLIVFVLAKIDETPEILELQKIAYQQEAILYEDWTITPLTQTLCEIRAEFDHSAFLVARREARVVGPVRVKSDSATCRIGRLIVHPDCQRQGTGTLLMSS